MRDRLLDPDEWQPRCAPARVVHPVRLDPTGVAGPTRGQARARRWRAVGGGFHVPSSTPLTPEQRAAEAAVLLPPGGLVTGWAALRLAGGGFFDGRAGDGSGLLPVSIRIPHEHRRAIAGVRTIRTTDPRPGRLLQGVPCADPETAVLDEMVLALGDRGAVVVADMALAAGLVSLSGLHRRLAQDPRRRGRRRVRWALALAVAGSRSPRETRMRLVWELDAGLPRPLVNARVVDLSGRLVGIADLLDADAGVAGEYDGALHRSRDRHRHDVHRAERFREVGIETFTVVAGDGWATQVARMQAARARALAAPPGPRRWRVVA